MSRSLNEIQDSILEGVGTVAELNTLEVLTDNEKQTIAGLTSFSKVAIWRLWVWVVAFGIWLSEQLWDVFKADIEARIAATRPFTEKWYTTASVLYQHGYVLPESGIYDPPANAAEEALIEASKVIDKAAVSQIVLNGIGAVRVKVATLNAGELEGVSPEILAGFQEYIEKIGAAGTYLLATSADADDLKIHYKIYFDSLILDNEGKRLDGTNDTPVQTAIKDYLKSVDFNGKLSLDKLDRVLAKVPGVNDVFLQSAASKFADFEYTDTAPSTGAFTEFRQPDSGYMKLDEAESVFEFIAS